ncbi:hypothetical protein POF50_018785 [Streptomyces sp. SL13]|uniref:Uncharacterized protein n=1 Tax=Streptantibioticus silvisoli TaxID=2705255 RepID=A0AA90H9J8_9ACTN|nr:hypothetical protein [Streptantibioticus silvisoli]MDI5971360.1 hypothetical protein [Streptantibioticus silvisoli]
MAQPTMSSGRITIIRGTRGVPVAVTALREGRSPSPSSSSSPDEQRATPGGRSDNPFAAPPKGAPDRPWQPRHPAPGDHDGGASGGSGDGNGQGNGGTGGGDRWSSRQPAPHGGGRRDPFGGGPGGPQPGPERRPGQGGPGGPGGQQGGGPRFDVTDPVQRRARYALMGGTAALFFGLYGIPELALLFGALALYWGISSLRGKAQPPAAENAAVPERTGADLSAWQSPRGTPPAAGGGTPTAATPGNAPGRPPVAGAQPAWGAAAGPQTQRYRPQFAAAVCGTIAASLALALVAAAFTFQLVYKDYYSCVNDALTQPARAACATDLPAPIRQHMSSIQGN